MEKMKRMLNSNKLKVIAIIAMTLDHLIWILYPSYTREIIPLIIHIIGRITCPLMCYFIAEGYYHTKNITKYTFRLFLFAIISHVPYMMFSINYKDWTSIIPFYNKEFLNQTSVMWSLAWGLVMLRIECSTKIKNIIKVILILLICIISFPSDWSCIASLCILAFGCNRGNFKKQMLWMVFYVFLYAVVYFFTIDKLYGVIQMGVVLAIPLIMLYNGQRGNNKTINKIMKWIFYIYYPLHLIILSLIRFLLLK